MEEQVGAIWHRFISGRADRNYPKAGVKLSEVQRGLSIFFRALGGDGGLQLEATDATSSSHRRQWLQRVAGINDSVELAWRDQNSLRLPSQITCFDKPALNRDLYYWLAALATVAPFVDTDWINTNQQRVNNALNQFPGLKVRYQRLLDAHLAERP